MDRNKSLGNRAPKKVAAPLGNEFYALGCKSHDVKAKANPVTAKNPTASFDRKRESNLNFLSNPKRLKVNTGRTTEETTVNTSSISDVWDQMAMDCEPFELVPSYLKANNDIDSAIGLLCGAIKQLSTTRSKPDLLIFLNLSYIAKQHPEIFCNQIVTGAMQNILKRDVNLKPRQHLTSLILSSNLLAKGYESKTNWPVSFLHTYVEDSINERNWVDNEFCLAFTENVSAVFQTKTPPEYLLQTDGLSSAAATPHATGGPTIDDDSSDNVINSIDQSIPPPLGADRHGPIHQKSAITNRFTDTQTIQKKFIIETVKEQLNKRQQQDNYTRNLLKFLCTVSGIIEVRQLCISRLELWIHSGKLIKSAQHLMAYISCNITSNSPIDNEILGTLVKMRLKTKPLINYYMTCLKEIINTQPNILTVIMRLVVQNELSNTRNPNNMGMLATMFQNARDESALCLAGIYKEFLLQRDDCLRTLRVFLRELVRMLRFDINLITFCKAFLNAFGDQKAFLEKCDFADRIFHSIIDLACLCMLLLVSPQVREANMGLRTNRDMKCNATLLKYYNQMSEIQLQAVSWMYESVPQLFQVQCTEYNQSMQKILLLENADQYSRYDQWPSEPERPTILKIASETPILEETLVRIVLMGLSKEVPLSISDSIDTIMLLIKRASTMRVTNIPAVQVVKYDVIDFLFNMAEYHHPENITLPLHYEAPKLAIIVIYWKVWVILVMISAHNPTTIGAFCWEHYPTIKLLMEMCITNQFVDVPISTDELQILHLERDHILEFESYLAAQTSQAIITEENAILTSQLMLMDPMGSARRIPVVFLEQLKYLNNFLKLGHMLCRSRKPDLLLDIIQRQGTTQSMPWLSDLVQNNEGDFNHLPVQCLCEFILFNVNVLNEENTRDAELLNYLRTLVDSNKDKQSTCEVLDYIFRRLSSTVQQTRIAALAGLKLIFQCQDSDNNDWLLHALPEIPSFAEMRTLLIPQLRAACQVENCPKLVMSYIQFIATYTLNDSVTEMLDHVIDMAQLIVERSTMFQHIIPHEKNGIGENIDPLTEARVQTLKCLFVMFNNYIIKLRENRELFEWTEYPDLLLVQFQDDLQLPLHLSIIHAFIILLTHSSITISESLPILDYWFPLGRPAPIGFVPNNPNEIVQLLPDWLKLKMIRSPVDRLIEAALHCLEPDQIVLFVQNFGTPINSMSKLLALLDHAVTNEIELVRCAILNKAYLAQLIEIQQKRGARNGHLTVQALGLQSHSQTVPDLPRPFSHTLGSFQVHDIRAIRVQTINTKRQLPSNEFNSIEDIIHEIAKCEITNDWKLRKLVKNILLRSENTNLSLRISNAHTDVHQYSEIVKKPALFSFLRALSLNQNGLQIMKPNDWKQIVLNIFKTLITTITYNQIIDGGYYDYVCLVGILKLPKCEVNMKSSNSYMTRQSTIRLETDSGYVKQLLTENYLSSDGLYVDRLSETDPELNTISRSDSKNNVFLKTRNSYRFYLLSLISHQTNWKSLVITLNYLLTQPGDEFNSTMVLNFIDAMINNPRLWQGRDKSVAKNHKPEVVTCFYDSEIETFASFILREREEEITINSSADITDSHICSRIGLLLTLINRNYTDLVTFVRYVNKSNHMAAAKMDVFRQVYQMYPSVKFIENYRIEDLETLKNMSPVCVADKVSCNLITCLGNLMLKKDFESLSVDTELLIRKLATSHPILFLRQFGMMSSFIQGRSQLSVRILRDEYHCYRFIQILRTLEILQPHIFHDNYKADLQKAIACYFNFLKQHFYARETYHILIKFVDLLLAYIHHNPTSAFGFIDRYADILTELALKFSSVLSLQKLIEAIAQLQHKALLSSNISISEIGQDYDLNSDDKESDKIIGYSSTMDESVMYPDNAQKSGLYNSQSSYSKTTTMSPHFLNLIKTITHSNSEDVILGPLQEIEAISSKRFSVLSGLFDRLLELIFSSSAQIRSNAFILLIRHIKHNPGRLDINRCTFNAYMQCLCDDNSSVAATAVDNLPDMTLLLQEYAVEILSATFALGIRSRINTSIQIKRVLQTIALQHGY